MKNVSQHRKTVIITLVFNAKYKTSLQKANYEPPSLSPYETKYITMQNDGKEMEYLNFYRRYHRV